MQEYQIKQLIFTHYTGGQPSDGLIINNDLSKSYISLQGNGSFDSKECVEFLKYADIVITNPPFSRFIDIINLINKYNKKFILLGDVSERTKKDVYTMFQYGQIYNGVSITSGGLWFRIPDYYEVTTKDVRHDKDGNIMINIPVRWYTNINLRCTMPFYKTGIKYRKISYQTYDNYNAINIDSIKLIPDDYKGVMGVPVTFLDKYNPNQFKIVQIRKGNDNKDLRVNGNSKYTRILIQRLA